MDAKGDGHGVLHLVHPAVVRFGASGQLLEEVAVYSLDESVVVPAGRPPELLVAPQVIAVVVRAVGHYRVQQQPCERYCVCVFAGLQKPVVKCTGLRP